MSFIGAVRKAFRRSEPERLDLEADGFALYLGESLVGRVRWREVEWIDAFKRDAITVDDVCCELGLRGTDSVWFIHEDVPGFWDVVKAIKRELPDSMQDWERVVILPPFRENRTTIVDRRSNRTVAAGGPAS